MAAAEAERRSLRPDWARTFAGAMADFAFLPAGRILAGAGSGRDVTLFNCFVMGRIEDDLSSIFDNVKQAALTMQAGGGIGHDFSTLRPKGALVKSIGADASGPVSFMDVWDAMCRTIMSAGSRRGAMMATLRCDHPDIELFVDAKREPGRLRNFNLSVLVTDAFMQAVEADAAWPLVFEGRHFRTISARGLWARIMQATYDVAEPGVIFIDRINQQNTLSYCEEIHATNPCGEQPLPAHGACLLGSINLAALVQQPFSGAARIDEQKLQLLAATAVRFLDCVIDVSRYPLKAQKREARGKRRIGLGVTGLADALIMLGVRYGSPDAIALTGQWLRRIKLAAYQASADLAAEKGSFELFDAAKVLAAPALANLPRDLRRQIRRTGLRNGLLTSIAPTGTISLLAGNVSSGIEPVFGFSYDRRILNLDGQSRQERVEDYAYALYRRMFGPDVALTDAFVTAETLTPGDHLAMQAAAQAEVDSSISKTINCPAGMVFEAFQDIYRDAYRLGLKGCTTYRPNAVTGAVLSSVVPEVAAAMVVEAGDVARAVTHAAQAKPLPRVVTAADAEISELESSGDVVYMARPLERDGVLEGFTYKLKWPGSDHALYITINDIVVGGRRRPFEIFINSKNLEHYAWTLALTRMISAIFRRGGDVSFVVEELKAVFDPQGGRWMDGHYVPSLLAAIGGVIEAHLKRIGFLVETSVEPGASFEPRAQVRSRGQSGSLELPASGLAARSVSGLPELTGGAGAQRLSAARAAERAAPPGSVCPKCIAPALVREEGCWVCRNCDYSRCG